MPALKHPRAALLLLLVTSFAHAFLLPPPPPALSSSSSHPQTKSMQPVAPLAASVMDQGTSCMQGAGEIVYVRSDVACKVGRARGVREGRGGRRRGNGNAH